MKRLLLALILIVPTFGAATLPDLVLESNPWPNCLPCDPPPPPPDDPGGQFVGAPLPGQMNFR